MSVSFDNLTAEVNRAIALMARAIAALRAETPNDAEEQALADALQGQSDLLQAELDNVPNPTPLFIQDVATSNILPTEVTVSWTTTAPADSQVEYGLTTAYGNSTTVDASMVTSRSIGVGGLTPATEYHFRVISMDAEENVATSDDGTFTTTS